MTHSMTYADFERQVTELTNKPIAEVNIEEASGLITDIAWGNELGAGNVWGNSLTDAQKIELLSRMAESFGVKNKVGRKAAETGVTLIKHMEMGKQHQEATTAAIRLRNAINKTDGIHKGLYRVLETLIWENREKIADTAEKYSALVAAGAGAQRPGQRRMARLMQRQHGRDLKA